MGDRMDGLRRWVLYETLGGKPGLISETSKFVSDLLIAGKRERIDRNEIYATPRQERSVEVRVGKEGRERNGHSTMLGLMRLRRLYSAGEKRRKRKLARPMKSGLPGTENTTSFGQEWDGNSPRPLLE